MRLLFKTVAAWFDTFYITLNTTLV